MNVANLIATGTTGVDTQAGTSGKNAATGQGTLGALFAIQMENALSQTNLADAPPELKGDGDFSNLQDLLAMLQQLLSGTVMTGSKPELLADDENQLGTVSAEDDVASTLPIFSADSAIGQAQGLVVPETNDDFNASVTPEKANQLFTFLTQLMAAQSKEVPLDNETIKPVVATFMQQGFTQQDAVQFVQSLAQFARAGEQSKQPEVHAAAEQISQLLTQLGVNTADGKDVATKNSNSAFDSLVTKSLAKQVPSHVNNAPASQSVQPNLNLLKVNKALTSYQVETGLASRIQEGMGKQATNVSAQVASTVAEPTTTEETMTLAVPQQQTVPVMTKISTGDQTVPSYPVKADQFASQVSDVFVKQLKVGSTNGLSEAKLILHPQSLGQVDVKITSHNGLITAQFQVDSRVGKEVLDSQLSQLRTALTQQGLQVDRLEVTQQQSQEQQFSFQQQKEQSRQQSFARQQENKDSQQEDAVFSIEQNDDGEVSTQALWNRARGAGSVNYSA